MSAAFSASGVITLTTDFGQKGPFVAAMKGMMLSRYREAQIIDLTHDTVVHWPAEAGFWLERSYGYFPKGTVHCAVVDPGVGTERDILVAEYDGHVFIAPDNGLLAALLEGDREKNIRKVDFSKLPALGIRDPSPTFQGRDIFAPVAAEIASGQLAPHSLGPAADELIPSWVEPPDASSRRVSGVVITVDHFGNLFTNIDGTMLARFEDPVIEAGGHTIELAKTYGLVRPGEYLALINSFGVLEVARAQQSASDGLGLERGAPVIVRGRNPG